MLTPAGSKIGAAPCGCSWTSYIKASIGLTAATTFLGLYLLSKTRSSLTGKEIQFLSSQVHPHSLSGMVAGSLDLLPTQQASLALSPEMRIVRWSQEASSSRDLADLKKSWKGLNAMNCRASALKTGPQTVNGTEFFDKSFFPAIKDALKKNGKEALDEKELELDRKFVAEILNKSEHAGIQFAPAAEVLQALLEQRPAFKAVWELANRKEKISLKEGSLFPTEYDDSAHTIKLQKTLTFKKMAEDLCRQTCAALQREPLLALKEEARQGVVGEEEFAVKRLALLKNGFDLLADSKSTPNDFLAFWKDCNRKKYQQLFAPPVSSMNDLPVYFSMADRQREIWRELQSNSIRE